MQPFLQKLVKRLHFSLEPVVSSEKLAIFLAKNSEKIAFSREIGKITPEIATFSGKNMKKVANGHEHYFASLDIGIITTD